MGKIFKESWESSYIVDLRRACVYVNSIGREIFVKKNTDICLRMNHDTCKLVGVVWNIQDKTIVKPEKYGRECDCKYLGP